MRRSAILLLPTLLSLAAVGARADDDPPDYAVREAKPHVGTNIPRNEVSGSRIPLDKRYADFTPEEKARVRSQYENMDPNDEPPWPIDGLGVLYHQMHEVERKIHGVGDVSLMVEVGSDGKPRSIASYKDSDRELVAALAQLLMQQTFKPAVCKGQPCVMQFPVRMSFHHTF